MQSHKVSTHNCWLATEENKQLCGEENKDLNQRTKLTSSKSGKKNPSCSPRCETLQRPHYLCSFLDKKKKKKKIITSIWLWRNKRKIKWRNIMKNKWNIHFRNINVLKKQRKAKKEAIPYTAYNILLYYLPCL